MSSEMLLGLFVDRSYDMRLRYQWSSIWSDFLLTLTITGIYVAMKRTVPVSAILFFIICYISG